MKASPPSIPLINLNPAKLTLQQREMISRLFVFVCNKISVWNQEKKETKKEERKNYRLQPFHVDTSTGELRPHPISIAHKAVREIDAAIRQLALSTGTPLLGSAGHSFMLHPRARTRTITMLIGLKYFIRVADGSFQNATQAEDNFQETIRGAGFFDSVSADSIQFPDEGEAKISCLLLLVHAIKYSQISWPRDFHYEYHSADRARKALQSFLKSLENIQKTEVFSTELNILFHMIRWHALFGQNARGSATLFINDIINALSNNLLPFFAACAYADHFLRYNHSATEFKVEEILRDVPCDAEQLLTDEFVTEILRETKEEYGLSLEVSKFYDAFQKKETAKDSQNPKYIISYGFGHKDKQYITRFLKALGTLCPSPEQDKNIKHYSLLRTQFEAGLFSTKEQRDAFQKGNGNKDRFFYSYHRDEKIYNERGLNLTETTCIIVADPAFLASHLYGIRVKPIKHWPEMEKNSCRVPLRFLAECFNTYCKENNKPLPFPLVKRLTDLCSAFNEIQKAVQKTKPPQAGSNERPVFRASLIFDGGTVQERRFDLFLPDIKDEAYLNNLAKKNNQTRFGIHEVVDVLTRYLCSFVTNYGMLVGWRNVDFDFSESVHYSDAESSFWRQRMEAGKRVLGLHIFWRYLENVAGAILRISYERQQFKRLLDPQSLTDPIRLPENISGHRLVGRYVLGIDIGGTAIKVQFFKLGKKIESQNSGQAIVAYINNSDAVVLTPTIPKYSIPTCRNSPAHGTAVYRDARDFAGYVLKKMKGNLGNGASDVLENTIAISLAWPGPVVDNHIVGVSGTLKMFSDPDGKAFTGQVMQDSIEKIKELDLAAAFRDEFISLIKDNAEDSANDMPSNLTVALINDGDAEALGTLAWRVTKDEGWKDWFSRHAVAITKAGTGLAGAVIANGRLNGLNEFGKLIIDLSADNSVNQQQPSDRRWPVGEANKRFSLNFLRNQVTVLGVTGQYIEGRDLEVLYKARNANGVNNGATKTNPDSVFRQLGALELCQIVGADVEYNDLIDDEADTPKNVSLCWDNSYRKFVVGTLEGSAPRAVDSKTLWQLSHLWILSSKDRGLPPFQIDTNKPIALEKLLLILGKNRVNHLSLDTLLSKDGKTFFQGIGERMGQGLADLATLLHDFCGIRTLFMSGGPVSGQIGNDCYEAFKKGVAVYLNDRYYSRLENNNDGNNSNIRTVCSERQSEQKEDIQNQQYPLDHKLWTDRDKASSRGMLGAAVRGVQQYIEDQKILELQKFKRGEEGGDFHFASNDEMERARAAFSIPEAPLDFCPRSSTVTHCG